MEISLHCECPSSENYILRVFEHDGYQLLLGSDTAVVNLMEDQRDRIIPSQIASDRVMGKSKKAGTQPQLRIPKRL